MVASRVTLQRDRDHEEKQRSIADFLTIQLVWLIFRSKITNMWPVVVHCEFKNASCSPRDPCAIAQRHIGQSAAEGTCRFNHMWLIGTVVCSLAASPIYLFVCIGNG